MAAVPLAYSNNEIQRSRPKCNTNLFISSIRLRPNSSKLFLDQKVILYIATRLVAVFLVPLLVGNTL